jgi:hypothetical protein
MSNPVPQPNTSKAPAPPAPPPPKVEVVSDLAAAERELDAYLSRMTAQPRTEPEAHVPFALDNARAAEAFKKWLNGLGLVPGDLKKTAQLGPLQAVYVPFWAVSAMTYVAYQGERGDNYKEKEQYKDGQGQTQTREVTKVRWHPASGEVKRNFENVLVCAHAGLADDRVALVRPVDPKRLQPYRANGSATVERCAVEPKSAFNKARTLMEAENRKLVEADIKGDQRKVSKMETRHVGVTLRHVVAPAYQGTFRYKGKDYPIFMSGATGEVTGEYPVSAGKVALVVLIFVLLVAAILGALYYFLIGPALQEQHGARVPPAPPALVATATGQAERA